MNICIFPGTFNPIHIAHLRMANFVLNKFKFDKIIFIPSYIPPHKQIDTGLAIHRYNMVNLIVKTNPKFDISDVEYQSENKSYTLITVQKIREQYNISGRISMIIGTDAFINIKTWYKVDELKKLVHFIVFPRGNDIINLSEYEDFNFELVNCEKMDISSTEMRIQKKGETTPEVREYINRNELYN